MRAIADKPTRRYLWRYEVRRTRCLVAREPAPATYDEATLCSHDFVAAAFRGIAGQSPRERFLAFYLDNRNRVVGFETIAIGDASCVHVSAGIPPVMIARFWINRTGSAVANKLRTESGIGIPSI